MVSCLKSRDFDGYWKNPEMYSGAKQDALLKVDATRKWALIINAPGPKVPQK
jgi:hypothetical protein